MAIINNIGLIASSIAFVLRFISEIGVPIIYTYVIDISKKSTYTGS